jgi:transposase InsO family protein
MGELFDVGRTAITKHLKTIYLHDYLAEDDLYASVEEFAYVWYNHVRPHSYNGYKTSFEARTGISNY